jgi:CDP-diacylglycerol--serine O-phosphatidyltransferase
MTFLRHIPNIFTLLNLLSGTIAVIYAVENNLVGAAFMVFLGIFFDFWDGFTARLLGVQGELGKQLDSLADVVTSGVVPGIVLFKLINQTAAMGYWETESDFWFSETVSPYAFIGLLFTLGAAYRLAHFNIDTRQTTSFIGLPTPAAALVVLSLPLMLAYSAFDWVTYLLLNKWVLIVLTLVLCYLMNAEVRLFALKFKNYSWRDNKVKYIFVMLIAALTILLQFAAIPVIILLYMLLSLFYAKIES